MPKSNLSNERKKVPPNQELLKPGSKIKVDFKYKYWWMEPYIPEQKLKVEFKLKQ